MKPIKKILSDPLGIKARRRKKAAERKAEWEDRTKWQRSLINERAKKAKIDKMTEVTPKQNAETLDEMATRMKNRANGILDKSDKAQALKSRYLATAESFRRTARRLRGEPEEPKGKGKS